MPPIDREILWDMQVLVAVVDGGSIAAGARALRVTPSATSKRIAALEARLGVQLLSRTTRHMRVTAEGENYLARARELLQAVRALELSTRDDGPELAGEVRMSAPTVMGQELLAPILVRFLLQHPQLRLDLDLSERLVDLGGEAYDLVLRIATRPEGDLIARRIGTLHNVLVASPEYLRRHGRPSKLAQIEGHATLELSNSSDRGNWRIPTTAGERVVRVSPVFSSSRISAVRIAAVAGLGIARLPTFLIADDLRQRKLELLLPSCIQDRRGVYLLRPSHSHVPKRVRAVAELIARELPPTLAG